MLLKNGLRIVAICASILLQSPLHAAESITLDFATGYHGQIIDDEYIAQGIKVRARNASHGPDLAVVLDSDGVIADDEDLEAPFLPGEENLADLYPGNILILHERHDCDTESCAEPDDEGSRPAGWIEFEFDQPVRLVEMKILDVNYESGEQPAQLILYDANGNVIMSDHPVPGVNGQGRWVPWTIDEVDVSRARVYLPGDAALDDIVIERTQAVNWPPEFTSRPPAFVETGMAYAYSPDILDHDRDTVQLTLSAAPDDAVVEGDTLRWENPLPGQHAITLHAIDAAGNVGSQSFMLNVGELLPVTLDFEAFPYGTIIDDDYADVGVAVTAENYSDGVDFAVVFDSANPTGDDTDLAAPFDPGLTNATGEGELSPGHILILHERQDCDVMDLTCAEPDDETTTPSGWIQFAFSQPVTVHSLEVFDNVSEHIDDIQVEAFDVDGLRLDSGLHLPDTGKHKWDRLEIETPNVSRLRVNLDGDAAIDRIRFTPEAVFFDSTPPEITVFEPVDGQYTNQDIVHVHGQVNEPASVTINDETVELDDAQNFTTDADLVEGENSIRITATDDAGNSSEREITVWRDTVIPPPAIVESIAVTFENDTATLTAAPGTAEAGSTVTIRNQRTGETVSVIAAQDGSFSAQLGGQVGDVFEITVSDAAGNASEPVEIIGGALVIPPDPADVAPPLSETAITPFHEAVEFIYAGPDPIQLDVEPETIKARRVVVLRGKVMTRDGEPLLGAKVTVNNHSEYGYTVSRADGAYDLAVNGGGHVTVTVEKEGFLPSQRTVKTPWRDYVVVDGIALVALDPEVTTINLSALTEIAVAQGSVVQDEDGQRQATILVPPGTSATMTLPDGTQQALSTINVRATEYTVGDNGPAAMPGELPPTTAYTYAVELSVDEAISAGASRVDFSQPLPFYVDNFLDFPVGEVVPLGWYDRERAVWVPADNGKIVEIIDIDANGLAVLDVDGSEAPASAEQLDDLGIIDDERRNLANLYSVGKSLWRVQIDHFTPWDCNWPYGPPEDAEAPPAEEPEGPDEDQPDTEDDDCKGGCIIEARRRNLGESVPIAGTPFTLNYRSNRMPGYVGGRTIEIPLSGESVPATLKGIELEVNIAGRTFSEVFPAEPNQVKKFVWDGKDIYGRDLRGAVTAKVTINHLYPIQYYAAPTDFAQSFTRFGDASGGGIRVIGQRGSSDIRVMREYTVSLNYGLPLENIGGWTLDVQHSFDAVDQSMKLGDGRFIGNTVARDLIIETVARNGANGAPLYYPRGVAFGSDGTLYIADTLNKTILRVGSDGIVTIVAGKHGYLGYAGDGGPATEAQLYFPHGVAVDPDGALFIADFGNHRIRRVGPDGIITTVAGNGIAGYAGDGGPATEASINHPYGVAIGPDGALFISDFGSNRIRRVGPDGIITTVAGNGAWGDSGDGGPASEASFNHPRHVAVGPDGALYIADLGNHRIRRVGPNGIITTLAGNGIAGYAGDGSLATEASINQPHGVAVGPDGTLFITDFGNRRIRRVGPDGVITTVAGKGFSGYAGDGGPATEAGLAAPYGIAISPDNRLYIADSANQRIRRLRSAYAGTQIGEAVIAAPDGESVYIFDGIGRHLRTLDALNGEILHAFSYDDAGRLVSITDVDNQVTVIERDNGGQPVAIIAPAGQRTELGFDADSYLATVTHPDNSTHRMEYSEGGLLAAFTNPNNNINRFIYDDDGFFVRDIDAAGGGWIVDRVDHDDGYKVTMTSAEGRANQYTVEPLSTGDRKQRTITPDGTETVTEFRRNGETETTYTDGTRLINKQGPDPRFGMQAPIAESITLATPAGLVNEITQQRNVELADDSNLFSLETQTDIYTLNGKTRTVAFDALTRETTETSPEGRTSMVRINTKGRPELVQAGILAETAFTYTPEGRVETITVGEGVDARNTTFSYYASGTSKGWLESVTDAEGRTVTYEYDPAGRVTKQVLPDLREIGYGYDANGNLTSITPPGRPAHEFTFTPVDMEDGYTPPDVLPGNDATDYAYNLDKQLELVTLPDGRTIDYVYGATTGKLNEIVVPTGSYGFDYKPGTGQLETLRAPGAEQLAFAYDGFLTTSVSSTGTINGTVSYGYNNDFRTQSLTVNGDTVSFAYDDDGILTTAGSLTLVPDAANGFLDTTSLGVVSTDNDTNTFGELDVFTAAISGSDIYSVDYQRDKLGRITRKTETIEGVTTTYDYTYDLAGRLDTVSENGIQTKDYDYDSNGNRTHVNGVSLGLYDDQDRLNAYGSCNYAYTENGELDIRDCGGSVLDVDYDVLGNLRRAELPNGDIIEYVIDGQNRRIGKKVNGVLVQGFLYQNQLNPVAEVDGSGNVVARFIYADKPNVPAYMIKGGNTYRIISDHLGSPRLIIDTATGVIVQRVDYDEWGNVTQDSNPGFQPFGFAGGIYDQHTSLVRFGARDYDPQTGRWTTKDPIRFDGGVNLYQYAAGDPVNLIDSTGREPYGTAGYINQYLSGNSGDAYSAWAQAYNDRFGPAGNPNNAELRDAEHYLYNYWVVQTDSYQWGPQLFVTTGYSALKGVGLKDSGCIGPTWDEMFWGWQGANDALFGRGR